jgi:hypothetical protein
MTQAGNCLNSVRARFYLVVVILFCAATATAQTPPNWLQFAERESNYPSAVYITGFSTGNARAGETKTDAEARLRKDAQAELTEKILVQVNSEKQKRDTRTKTQTTGQPENEQITSIFESTVTTSSNLDLTGVKTDAYTDPATALSYGFAFVNKYELIGYYNAALAMNIQQLEGILTTAQQLETDGEKAKARTQYQQAAPLLAKIEQSQDILVALDNNATPQRDKTAQYRSNIVQALARLAQGVHVYIESKEELFGTPVDIVANKLKAELAINGCSFVADPTQADFVLRLRVTTRQSDTDQGLIFCYADAAVELFDTKKQKNLYSNEIAIKGGSNSLDKAGRKALGVVATEISKKLKPWIE